MKRKWYRIEEVELEGPQGFHCWGEKIGMDVCEYDGNKFYCRGNQMDKRISHVMPFPLEPRLRSR